MNCLDTTLQKEAILPSPSSEAAVLGVCFRDVGSQPPHAPQGSGTLTWEGVWAGKGLGRTTNLPHLTIVPVPLPNSVPRTTRSTSSGEFPL